MMCGVKRKHEAESDELPYVDQRQSVFNLSVHKLKTWPQKKCSTSLRRSVLIFNTMKQIQTELEHEGFPTGPMGTPLLHPSIVQNSEDHDLDPLPNPENCVSKVSIVPSPCTQPVPDSMECSDSIKPSSDLPTKSTSSCVTPIIYTDTHNDSSVLTQPTESNSEVDTSFRDTFTETKNILDSLLSSDKIPIASFQSLFEMDTNGCNNSTSYSWSSQCSHFPSSDPQAFTNIQSSAFSFSSTHYRQDSETNTELDMALFDLDLFTPVSSKLTPLSAEELTHSLPPTDTYSYLSSTASHWGQTSLHEDLDHIMQILVGI